LLTRLERDLESGDLKGSEFGPDLIEALRRQAGLQLVESFDQIEPPWIVVGIRESDFWIGYIRPSAGQSDWQRDYPTIATPLLVAVARSFEPSVDVQSLMIRLCDVIAQHLSLTLHWPDQPDDANELKNAIYREALQAMELDSDDVRALLQKVLVTGPS